MNKYPSDWRSETFGSICEKIMDGTHFSPKTKSGSRLYLTSKNIKNGKIDLSNVSCISEDEHREIYSRCDAKKGDILLTKDGANTGNAAINSLDEEFSLLSSVAVIRPNIKHCDTGYAFQWLISDFFQALLKSRMAGNAISRLTLQKINDLPIAIPPLPEQKKIAEILSGVDKVINNLKNCLGKQDILKSSLLSELIFHSDANSDRSSKTNYCCLGDISTRITDGTHQAVKTSKDGAIPFLYVSCVKDGIIDWSKSALISEEQYAIATQGRQPTLGDILYTAVGSYGNAAMVTTNHRFCFQRHIALIQLDKEKAVPKFIELALSSDQTKKSVDQVVAGNAQPTLTLGELRKLQIPLPHPESQRKICEVIYPVEQQCCALENKINAMHNLKQAVASDLLSGRKRVPL